MKNTMSEYIIVKQSSIHNKGIFAKTNIPKGTKIIEYVGEKITKAESDRRCEPQFKKAQKNKNHGAVYFFDLNNRYDLDGNVTWNTARYINHSCTPNCETENIRGRIWIIATKDIKKGDELGYNYGYEFDEDFTDHVCHCGSDNCVGYILAEEYWKKLEKKLQKECLLY